MAVMIFVVTGQLTQMIYVTGFAKTGPNGAGTKILFTAKY